jgi:hypothetical protein
VHTVLPWGHLAFGYLVYSLGGRLVHGRPPVSAPTLLLAVGTQVPDLIDKPLNWWFGVLDGRGIGHSVLVMVPVCLLVYLVARRYDRGHLGGAFAVGTLTHLFSDAWLALVAGEVRAGAPYLLWPLLPAPTYEKDSVFDHLDQLTESLQSLPWSSPAGVAASWFGLQLVALTALVVLWLYDGLPGVSVVTAGWARLTDSV